MLFDLSVAKLKLSVFPGGFNWPSFVAQEKGFFAVNGLEVTLQSTPNSVAQMTSTHFYRSVIRASNEFESQMSHLFASLPARIGDSGY